MAVLGLLIWSALWLTLTHYVRSASNLTKNIYSAIDQQLSDGALNCTNSIPHNLLQMMRVHEPPFDSTGGQMLAEYLQSCLQKNIVSMQTPPFSLTDKPRILYNIALNQVVSLGFDGTLQAKARHLTIYYLFYEYLDKNSVP